MAGEIDLVACVSGEDVATVRSQEEQAETEQLLQNREESIQIAKDGDKDEAVTWREVLEELKLQALMAGPLAGNMLCLSLMGMCTLSFTSSYGTEAVAAAALGTAITFMFGRLPMVGMSCALDTLASQAFGAGQLDALALFFQRTCAFLLIHALGFSIIILTLPALLEQCGYEHRLCIMVATFSRVLLPSIFVDAVNRPMNRILVAQRITQPQAWMQALATLFHFAINYLLVSILKGPFYVTAWAYTMSTCFTFILFASYMVISQKGFCTWGSGPSMQALKNWRDYSRLAYPAGFMQCAEAWCYGSMNLLAGFLPNPETNVAALSVAFSLFQSVYYVYLSQALACSTRVGNLIGGGNAKGAKISMMAARLGMPLTWLVSAFVFSEPHFRDWFIWVFTDGSDEELLRHINRLLWLMVALNFMDGVQAVLSGVIQGLGRQSFGFYVNLIAFYVIAFPLAALFGFVLHLQVEGLYCGIFFGATTQAIAFTVFSSKVDWILEAKNAEIRVKAQALQNPSSKEPETAETCIR